MNRSDTIVPPADLGGDGIMFIHWTGLFTKSEDYSLHWKEN